MTEVEYADLNYSQVEPEESSSESENENGQVPGKKRACWTNDEVRGQWHFKLCHTHLLCDARCHAYLDLE
jgi:hypothetical protein